jgi:hypothetical protein
MEAMNPRLDDSETSGLDAEELAACFGTSRKLLGVVLPRKPELLS